MRTGSLVNNIMSAENVGRMEFDFSQYSFGG